MGKVLDRTRGSIRKRTSLPGCKCGEFVLHTMVKVNKHGFLQRIRSYRGHSPLPWREIATFLSFGAVIDEARGV
jgi:hypothetical protein